MTLRKALPGYLFASCLGLLALGWTVVCIGRRDFLTAAVTLSLGAAFFSMTVPPTRSISGRVEPRVSSDGGGTTFRPDRIFEIGAQSMSVFGTIGFALFAIFYPLGKLDIPVPHAVRYSVPFLAGAVALMGIPTIWLMIHRGGTKYLRLTPAGYVVAEGYKPERGGWDEIIDVTGVVPESIRQLPNALVLAKSDGTAAVLAAGAITPGGRDLRELVRFYWQHPGYRDELTDDRALERLQNKNFAADR
ncbi:hypothetical protein AB0876_01765 [Mycobacterium sp. NPDC049093]